MTDITELQNKLDKASEYVQNSQFDEAVSELKEELDKTDCSICKYEISITIANISHNRDICILGSDDCNEETEAVIEQISELRKDLELAKEFM